MQTIKIRARMDCPSCVLKIESALKPKVIKVDVNFILKIVKVVYDETSISATEIRKIINDLGYGVD